MHKHLERGMATAEYCVGTIGAALIALWLSRIAMGDPAKSWFGQLARSIISRAFDVGDLIDRWKVPWFM